MNISSGVVIFSMILPVLCLILISSLLFAETLILSVHLFGREHKIRMTDLIWGPLPIFLIAPLGFIGAFIYGFYKGLTAPDTAALNYNYDDIVSGIMNFPYKEAVFVVTSYLPALVYVFLISLFLFKKDRIRAAIVNVLLFSALYLISIDSITDIGIFFVHDTQHVIDMLFDVTSTSNHLNLIIELIGTGIVITIYVLSRILLVKRGKKYDIKPKYAVILSLTVIFIHILVSIPFLGIFDEAQSNRISRILLAVFVPLMTILLPVAFIVFIHRKRLKEQSISQANYLEAELEYINSYKKRENDTRIFRREIAEKLTSIDELFEKDDIPAAQEKIEEMLGGIRALSPKFVTGDEMLDLIVSMKASVMDQAGIKFTCDGVVDGGLNMKPFDVCGIFANALDNAIEACRSVGKDKDLKVDMNITRTPAFFLIKISNSCLPDVDASKLFVDGEVFTTKKDRSLHGIGTQNIKNAVESYGGMVKAKAENSVFELSITLPRD